MPKSCFSQYRPNILLSTTRSTVHFIRHFCVHFCRYIRNIMDFKLLHLYFIFISVAKCFHSIFFLSGFETNKPTLSNWNRIRFDMMAFRKLIWIKLHLDLVVKSVAFSNANNLDFRFACVFVVCWFDTF